MIRLSRIITTSHYCCIVVEGCFCCCCCRCFWRIHHHHHFYRYYATNKQTHKWITLFALSGDCVCSRDDDATSDVNSEQTSELFQFISFHLSESLKSDSTPTSTRKLNHFTSSSSFLNCSNTRTTSQNLDRTSLNILLSRRNLCLKLML